MTYCCKAFLADEEEDTFTLVVSFARAASKGLVEGSSISRGNSSSCLQQADDGNSLCANNNNTARRTNRARLTEELYRLCTREA